MNPLQSAALLPQLIYAPRSKNISLKIIGAWIGGVLLISILAQLAIPLPWTPIPVSGQTLAVHLVILLWGRRLAVTTIGSYVALGSAGLPIFAGGKSGLILGPSAGYVIGMVLAAVIVGRIVDHGFNRGFWRALGTCYMGSAIILGCGVIGLSRYLPSEVIFAKGLWPFLPGDLIKNISAALITSEIYRRYPLTQGEAPSP